MVGKPRPNDALHSGTAEGQSAGAGKTSHSLKIFLLCAAFSTVCVSSAARGDVRNSFQAGLEYDDNVFKTFGAKNGDALARLLFKSRGQTAPGPELQVGWDYQGGGKVFFEESQKDTLIQYLQLPAEWRIGPRFSLSLEPDFKYQNERNKSDAALISEDYYSTTTKLTARVFLPASFLAEPFAGFTFFHFDPAQNFSFYREWGGITVQKTLRGAAAVGAQYSYGRQQFQDSTREDRENQISGFFQYLKVPFFSARYTFQKSGSSDPLLSFTNHRISLLVSAPLWMKPPQTGTEKNDPEDAAALFALHVLGTLQLKKFPSVFSSTAEGQRFLLTGAEDENFNSILVKLSYHPFARVAFEAKYTRYSNEFSSREDTFSRSLYYGGARVAF